MVGGSGGKGIFVWFDGGDGILIPITGGENVTLLNYYTYVLDTFVVLLPLLLNISI